MNLLKFIASQIRRHPKLVELVMADARAVSSEASSSDSVIVLDYPIHPRPRWELEHPHPELFAIINENRELYGSALRAFLPLSSYFTRIPEQQASATALSEPCWINGWIPGLDAVALYGFLSIHRPKLFLEVGSGNSTKFARKAITDHHLDTKIVSIDPCPRAEIDIMCDEVIRKPVEEIELEIFDRLEANDILYIDNSHRVFMNSDATTLFLDVLPRLKPGVLVEIHDITLPYDYPAEWINRYYSEQYLLAAYLLAKGERFDILLPNIFISYDDELKGILTPLWETEEMKNVERHGCSFWIQMK